MAYDVPKKFDASQVLALGTRLLRDAGIHCQDCRCTSRIVQMNPLLCRRPLRFLPGKPASYSWHGLVCRGETMVRYLEFLGKELRLRRAKYNLTLQDKALVICKDATVHTDARFSELRHLREKEHNCRC